MIPLSKLWKDLMNLKNTENTFITDNITIRSLQKSIIFLYLHLINSIWHPHCWKGRQFGLSVIIDHWNKYSIEHCVIPCAITKRAWDIQGPSSICSNDPTVHYPILSCTKYNLYLGNSILFPIIIIINALFRWFSKGHQ